MNKVTFVTGATESSEPTEREIRNRELALKAAEESIVLLKNESNALPIEPGKIAAYGAGVSMTVKGGTGSGEVNERHTVTILEGLENAGFEITTKRWISDFEAEYAEEKRKYAERKAKVGILQFADVINIMNDPLMLPCGRVVTDADVVASDTDTALYVVARQAGEGTDKKLEKGEFDLMPNEKESLRKLVASYKKTILVINSGAQMDLSILDEINVSAVLYFCQQGEEGGTALANVLCGKANPSGKLVDTWAKAYGDVPFGSEYGYLSGDTAHTYYKEGIYVGYRYFDTFKVAPRYPFGFGLSYTTFSWTPVGISFDNSTLSLDIEVRNTGNYAGKEVVQVYVYLPKGALDKECKRLVAFNKSASIEPGQTDVVHLDFSMDYCASYDEASASFVLEAGDYVVAVGTNAAEIKQVAVVNLPATLTLSHGKNLLSADKNICELHAPEYEALELDANIARFELADYPEVTFSYETPQLEISSEAQKILDSLSDKELVELCVGQGFGCILNAHNIAALSCIGKSTDALLKKGILGVNFSDGPAGLRLSKGTAIKKRGKLKTLEYTMSFMEFMPKFMRRNMIADPTTDELVYQYCTAFPVGTAMAQTWNTELCEAVGAAIGVEMEEYYVTYWLAPAMNIHRNPLCGRNFEYYSEDPVVSGKIAAAVVRGVQSHPGAYATIKHFAANNQEDDRNKSDSIMDERTLREIYLRGFEICVREAAPAAVMTSYNKINGTYAPNSCELLTYILRSEWGFKGLVMTDWYGTGHDESRNDLAIAAGNDLIMPGMKACKKQILKGLKLGTVTHEQLKLSAGRFLQQILDSNVAQKFKPEMFV